MATYTTTAKYLLRKLTGTSDVSDVDDGIGALADDLDANMAGYAEGTLSARAGVTATAGKLYRTTDTGQVFMGTGSAWIEIGVSPWSPGDLKASWVTTAPAGWLLCDGSAVSRATYAALFAAIGTSAGAGDGSTTFNVPDARARALIMPDGTAARMAGSDTRGASGGEETHALTVAEIPDVPVAGANQGGAPPGSLGGGMIEGASASDSGGTDYALRTTTTGSFGFGLFADGGGLAHNNMSPYLVVGAVLIKT